MKRLKAENPDTEIQILGELIHNSHVISELEKLGIHTINDVKEVKSDCICVIRSHGAPPETIDEIEKRGAQIKDLTCPDVKKVQQKAVELTKEGYLTLIIGKAEHPEVVAIKANAELFGDNVFVVSNADDIRKLSEKIKKAGKIGVVVQTTQKEEVLQSTVSAIIPLAKEIKVFNTICRSTFFRQKEVKELAEKSDLTVVVGGKNSANSTNLAQIASKITETIHIEDADELEKYKDLIDKANTVSVTAGASTPDDVIGDVIEKLNEYNKGKDIQK